MRIWTLWQDEGEGDMPWLVDAYDEYTLDNCGDVPPTYQAHKTEDLGRRELIIDIPEEAVRALFATPEVKGSIEPPETT